MKPLTESKILEWLEEVKDPEIPVLSLHDLGIIHSIEVTGDSEVKVQLTPTFAGCPAIDHMVSEVENALVRNKVKDFTVEITFEKPWSSNNITPKGREALKKFGLAPPNRYDVIVDLNIIQQAQCPYCDSQETVMRSPFGPTLCRSLHYCKNCNQAFEQFKPL